MTQQGKVAHLGMQAKPWGSIDSKLRRCDLVKMKIGDIVAGEDVRTRAIAIQQKINRPVQFELTGDVRANVRLGVGSRRFGLVLKQHQADRPITYNLEGCSCSPNNRSRRM